MYRDQMDLHGEDIAIRRYSGATASRTHLDRPCRGRVIKGVNASELVGSVVQQNYRIIVLAEDLDGESPPFVITKSDKVVATRFRDELAILDVDDSTRRIGETLIAYELIARG